MKHERGNTMKNVHTITITLKEEWTKILDETFKKRNAKISIDGFRKGKAPKDVYIKKFGIESLYMDAVDSSLPVAYTKVLDDNNLVPVCEPKVDIKKIDENEVEFEFTVITKPEVKVSSYTKLGVKKEDATVTKEEVEHEIEHLRSHFAEFEVKEEGTVENGDTAVIDFEGFVDGVAFEGGKGEDYPLVIGSNTFIPGFEDQLIGCKKDETKDVNVTFPEEYVEELKGKDAVFKVTVKEIKSRILPELDEEFFKDLGYDDVKTKEELEKKIEEQILEHKNQDIENKYYDELMRAGIENMTVELNEEIIEDEVHRMLHDFEDRLSMQGITLEQYFTFSGTTEEEFKENAKTDAENRIKSRYLIDYIIENEKLEATLEEAEKHAEEQAKKYQMETSELIDMYGGIEVMKYDLLVHRAIEILGKN